MSDNQNKLNNWEKFLFSLGILFVIVAPGLFFCNVNNPKEKAIFLLISGVLLVIFSRFGDVRELGLFGLKAKLERVLSDAYATLDQVKEIAQIFARLSLSQLGRSGWLGGITEQQKREWSNSTLKTLNKLGFNDVEIKDIFKDYHECRLIDYRNNLLGHTIPECKNPECEKDWKAFRRRPVSPPIPPDELKDFFERYNFMDDELRKRLDGYAYYYEHHEFQDIDDFSNREKWPNLKSN